MGEERRKSKIKTGTDQEKAPSLACQLMDSCHLGDGPPCTPVGFLIMLVNVSRALILIVGETIPCAEGLGLY